ncbi:diaminopimelate decarboxylase [Thioflexithrix psekupsensis]|uniref:Diaminopimelate decarboxylase n=1 Tax=Thioflexithrix psekupsensis TaxID=1570016 RepID=A0A251XBS6_9GAMM|nr:diaminopimelate decarboxylase [Thioflexithrix psekupsensis]OUD15506.1 diaminopimelate decarboxylase [Thioflexithrix psekupsensis]
MTLNAPFSYQNGMLHAEAVNLEHLADQVGTPCFVYSKQRLQDNWWAFDRALQPIPHLICYAVKANSNIAVLSILAQLGSGFDIVSGGELTRVLTAGAPANKIVFSGVGKSIAEMKQALEANILCFNVESEAELTRLNQVAGEMGLKARISLRVNPDVDARTHPYISTGLKQNKFGIAITEAPSLYAKAQQLPHLEITGVDCHIGSQLLDLAPFADALQRILQLVKQLEQQKIQLHHIDFGGGLGVRYREEEPPEIVDYANVLLEQWQNLPYTLLLEPGRAIAADAGILLTRVEFLKNGEAKNFAIVDAAMNDLIRPALYGAWQRIEPVFVADTPSADPLCYDIVGPVCETGDFLGKDRYLRVNEGDLLAVHQAGAYGFAMSSNYNTRGRAAEILVSGHQWQCVRRRETVEDLLALESIATI